MAPDPIHHVEEAVADVLDEVGEDVSEFIGRLRDDLLGREGYLIVLLMTILVVILIPIDDDFRGGGIVTVAALGLLVFTTMSRSHVSHTLRVASAVVIAMSFVLAIVVTVTNDAAEARSLTWLAATFSATYTIMIGLCFPAILRRAFSHRQGHPQHRGRRVGGLPADRPDLHQHLPVREDRVDGPFFSQTDINPFTYEYFSYVTLTTVGYGDFTAANDAGRTLAMLEALFGQVFLVTIVALVVSNLGVDRSQLRSTMARQRTSTDDEAADGGAEPPPRPDARTDPAADPPADPTADPPGLILRIRPATERRPPPGRTTVPPCPCTWSDTPTPGADRVGTATTTTDR